MRRILLMLNYVYDNDCNSAKDKYEHVKNMILSSFGKTVLPIEEYERLSFIEIHNPNIMIHELDKSFLLIDIVTNNIVSIPKSLILALDIRY